MNSVLAAVSTYLLYAVPENTTVTIVTIDDDKEATCYSTPVSSFDQRRQLVMVVESVFKRQNLSDKCQPQQVIINVIK